MSQAPPACSRCGERPALLPARLHQLVPSGGYCRECLVHMFELSTRAARGVFGPLPFDSSPKLYDLMMQMELLRIEAALAEPPPTTAEELEGRWSRLIQERLSKEQGPQVDLSQLQQWLSKELGGG